MKKSLILSFLVLLCIAITFASCKKDKNDDPQPDSSSTSTTTDSNKSVKTETVKDCNGTLIGTRTITTSTVDGQSVTTVEIKDLDGNVIDTNAKFTITFDINGASGTAPSSQSGAWAETITLPSQGNLTYNDYEFLGWCTKKDGSGNLYDANAKYTILSNTTLYAMWGVNYTYAIEFDLNGGSDSEESEFLYINDADFTEIKLPSPSLKDDCVFKGWSPNANYQETGTIDPTGKNVLYPAGTLTKGDSYFTLLKAWLVTSLTKEYVTLYAIYETQAENKCKIVFDADGNDGEAPDPITFADFRTASFKFPLNTFTVPAGKVFAGWKTGYQNAIKTDQVTEKYYAPIYNWKYVGDDNVSQDGLSYEFYSNEILGKELTITFKPVFVESIKNFGVVSITHNSSSTYDVYIDGVKKETWTSSGTKTLSVTPNVQHTIEIKQTDGYIFTPTTGTKTFTVGVLGTIYFSGPVSDTSTEYFN